MMGQSGQGPSHEADLGMAKKKVSASKVGTESDLSEEQKQDNYQKTKARRRSIRLLLLKTSRP